MVGRSFGLPFGNYFYHVMRVNLNFLVRRVRSSRAAGAAAVDSLTRGSGCQCPAGGDDQSNSQAQPTRAGPARTRVSGVEFHPSGGPASAAPCGLGLHGPPGPARPGGPRGVGPRLLSSAFDRVAGLAAAGVGAARAQGLSVTPSRRPAALRRQSSGPPRLRESPRSGGCGRYCQVTEPGPGGADSDSEPGVCKSKSRFKFTVPGALARGAAAARTTAGSAGQPLACWFRRIVRARRARPKYNFFRSGRQRLGSVFKKLKTLKEILNYRQCTHRMG